MFLKNCKAYLKSMRGELLEIGYASISVTDKTVDFTNDFVPLLKLGTKVKIICVIKDVEKNTYVESHCFTGEVYLSSQHLLQIVSVVDNIMTGSEKCLTVDTSLPSRVCLLPDNYSPHGRLPLIRRWADTTAYLLAVEAIRFTCEKKFEKGQKLMLQMKKNLLLEEVVLTIDEVILFGSRLTGYRCRIDYLGEPDKTNLYEFVRKANLVFSDEAIIAPPEPPELAALTLSTAEPDSDPEPWDTSII